MLTKYFKWATPAEIGADLREVSILILVFAFLEKDNRQHYVYYFIVGIFIRFLGLLLTQNSRRS